MNRSTFSLEALDRPSIYIVFLIILISTVLYLPFLAVPFLPDDYLQITLARKFGPITQWHYLLGDTLFRNRATSIVLTYWTDRLFPLSAIACGISSILLHAANGLLLYGLGWARSIGWRLSAFTAIAFVLQERPHEAVVWYAALPELLVFLFGLTAIGLWLRWLRSDRRSLGLWAAMLSSFVMAALSKESAVAIIPLMAIMAFMEKSPIRRAFWGILPIAVTAVLYVAWVFQGREYNHHFYDGTFALQTGFLKTIAFSAGRGLWIWGWVAIALFLLLKIRNYKILAGGILWMIASLLPYSFLTYMQTVPSRHHYLAAAGSSLIIATAFLALSERRGRPQLIWWLFLVMAVHHAGYLWTSKYRQFEKRSEPIEAFIHFLDKESHRPVAIRCSEYLFVEAQRAAYLRRGELEQDLVLDLNAQHHDSPVYCLPGL